MRRLLAFLFVLAVPGLAAENDLVATLVKHWKVSKAYTIAVANQMPDDSYGFKPNPEQMTFAEQLAHLAGANAFFLSRATDTKPPIGKPASMDKATILKFLNDSFDYTIKAAQGLTPEQLHKEVDTPDGRMTGLEAVMFAMDHTTHHRGQLIVYLRVKNIKPTEYQY